MQPIEIAGQTIARSFWGRRWCARLDSLSDGGDRLPRGRLLVRSGAVCHLDVRTGVVEAMVAGSALFHVEVRIPAIEGSVREALAEACAGRVRSVRDLREGTLPDHVLEAVTHPERGLLPRPGEIEPRCGCTEEQAVCRHVAATLYGVGSRLDAAPELLFRLRGLDEAKLIAPGPAPSPGRPDGGGAPAEIAEPAAAPSDPPAGGDGPEVSPTGALIRQLRQDSGFSVVEFAELLRVTAATVRRWEASPGALTLRSGPRAALRALRDVIGEVDS